MKDIIAHESILRQMLINLDELNWDFDRIRDNRTFKGIYTNAMGYVFSAYCIFKLLVSAVDVAFGNDEGKVDTVTRVLALVVDWLGWKLDVQFWTGEISFLLVGVMALSSIRGILTQFAKMSMFSTTALSADLMIILMANIMGFYFLSVLLLLQTNLPPIFRYRCTDLVTG